MRIKVNKSMKISLLIILLLSLVFTCPVYGESESYRNWYDHWHSKGYEEGKGADKYDPDTTYKKYEAEVIQAKHQELQALVHYQEAEDFLKAAKEGFYDGYRSGYYREKEGEIIALIEGKFRDIKISDFKFGKMEPNEQFVITEETRELKVPTVADKKNYFGYTCNYFGNYSSDNKLTIILTLPGKPKKDLGPNFNPVTNTIIAKYNIKRGNGHFGNKWYFSKGDLTGKFRLTIYIGDKLVERIFFKASEK